MPRFALNPAKAVMVAGAVLIALAGPIFGTAMSIADSGSSSESPPLAGAEDHLWDR